jgi:hypothetical protein
MMKTEYTQRPERLLTHFLIASSMLLSIGCSPSDEESVSSKAAPSAVTNAPSIQIQITTASETARALYDEGQYFLDVGRGVQVRENSRPLPWRAH